jgi:hypothetical protein
VQQGRDHQGLEGWDNRRPEFGAERFGSCDCFRRVGGAKKSARLVDPTLSAEQRKHDWRRFHPLLLSTLITAKHMLYLPLSTRLKCVMRKCAQ